MLALYCVTISKIVWDKIDIPEIVYIITFSNFRFVFLSSCSCLIYVICV